MMDLVLKFLYTIMTCSFAVGAATEGAKSGDEENQNNYTKIDSSEDMQKYDEFLQDTNEREDYVSSPTHFSFHINSDHLFHYSRFR